ncbi:MAG: TIGR04149 family rSAM-modified RiPP [Ignavibacteria bacterium]|nr:TIGR04149 family rSAM-modified RiPP [Ignavibacteria bacterium]
MKKLGKLKLNQLSKAVMEDRELINLRGGYTTCTCGCCYEGNGGSSTIDNAIANSSAGKRSPAC